MISTKLMMMSIIYGFLQVNCLRLTERPIKNISELTDGVFFCEVLQIRFVCHNEDENTLYCLINVDL